MNSLLISTGIYFLIGVFLYILTARPDYGQNNDAAGAGMAKGYAILIGMALFVLLSLISLWINLYLLPENAAILTTLIAWSPVAAILGTIAVFFQKHY
jgi:hypothetical protein